MTDPAETARLTAVAAAGRAAGLADGSATPTGWTRNPHPSRSLAWWVWARWYVHTRRKTAAAQVTAQTRQTSSKRSGSKRL